MHRLCEGLKEERTACINRIRSLLAEFGLVFAQDTDKLRAVLHDVIEDASNSLPGPAWLVINRAYSHWVEIELHLDWCDQQLAEQARVGWQKTVVALANKNARIPWAILTRGERFDANHLSDKPEPPRQLTPTPPCPA